MRNTIAIENLNQAKRLDGNRQGSMGDEDMIAGVGEIRRTGGKELHEFIHEIEEEAPSRE